MTAPPLPFDEFERLTAVRAAGVLDTPAEPEFDRIVALAKAMFGADTALVSIVDADRQWFKSRLGLDACETPRDQAFCAHTILSEATLWVEDARTDPRFRDNPLVAGQPWIRFYAGAPVTFGGRRLGALCVFDARPQPYCAEYDGRLRALAAMTSDVLELRAMRQAADQETRAARHLVNDVVQHAPVPLVMTDRGLRVLQVSQRWIEHYGMPAAEVVGRTMHDIFPAGRAQWEPVYDRALAGDPARGERAATSQAGAERWFHWEAAPWRDASGAVGGLLLMNVDVTELVRAKDEAARARDAAQASDRTKAAFLANMSHEIRTPLNGVLGVTRALGATSLDPLQQQMLTLIDHSARGLEAMLTGALELANAVGGAGAPRREPLDLARLLSAVEAAFTPVAQAKGLTLTTSVAGDAPGPFLGDEARIQQIVSELVANALRFTERGGVAVQLRCEASEPRVRACFEVADTGPGFDMAEKERLFERFQQGDSSPTRRQSGSGVGLALARGLARDLGGDLDAFAEAGGGAVFTLTVMLDAPAAAESA